MEEKINGVNGIFKTLVDGLKAGLEEKEFNSFRTGAITLGINLGMISISEGDQIIALAHYPSDERCVVCAKFGECETRGYLEEGRIFRAKRKGEVVDVS